MLYIGLMSGTSMDAVDAVLVDFNGDTPRLVATHTHPLPADVTAAVQYLSHNPSPLRAIGELDVAIGRLFAESANTLVQNSGVAASCIAAIGSHGQTVYHQPTGPERHSIQLGDPNTIVERTGITTVADFRRRDMAAGGQGAPLAPAYHRHVFHSPEMNRVVLNIGGIANVTVLPRDPRRPVLGFDTGPGNGLMDSWVRGQRRGNYDSAGDWARSGMIDPLLLDRMLADPYFALAPPKSTGREYFSEEWIGRVLEGAEQAAAPQDVQATLLALTAVTIGRSLADVLPAPAEVYVCGGGVHNTYLMERLRSHCPGHQVSTTEALGTDPDWVEAIAFAWLAMRTLAGEPGNITSVTGARHPAILGGIYRA